MNKANFYLFKRIIFLLIFFIGKTCYGDSSEVKYPYHLGIYYAKMSTDPLEIFCWGKPDYDDSYRMIVAYLGKQIGSLPPWFVFEDELQFAWHYDAQDYWEVNGALVARFVDFPWNDIIYTSIAAGAGLSYISEISDMEASRHSETSQFLGYLLFEWELAPSADSSWSFFSRIHHRSGADGTFNHCRGASNSWGMGIRYHFG